MPLSILSIIVALNVLWCRHRENLKGSSPQLYADNLKRNSYGADTLLAAAQQTVSYDKLWDKTLLPRSVYSLAPKIAGKRMTAWRSDNVGCIRAVKLDVLDLRGHLDVTQRASDGILSNRVKDDISHVIKVGALTMGVSTNAWDGVFQIVACWATWM